MSAEFGNPGDRATGEIALSLIVYFIKPAEFLNEALASIVPQLGKATELIVVAGHQPHEDLGIAPHLLARIDRLIVEPDAGAWDAANKGWKAARGTWVQFVMADDLLPEGSIARTLAALSGCDADLVSGGLTFFATSGTAITRLRNGGFSLDRVLGELGSPSFIYRRALLQRLGGFDGRYRYSHDREFLLRAWCAGARYAALPHEVFLMRVHPDSRTTSGNAKVAASCQVEHVGFADRLMRDGTLEPAARRKLQRWRDEEFAKFWITKAYAIGADLPVALPADARLPLPRWIAAVARVASRKLLRTIRNPVSAVDPPGRFRVGT